MNATSAIPYSQQLQDSVWLDVNTRVGLNGKPMLLPDVHAINNSIENLFGCEVGERGPIFQPRYGSNFRSYIHEPLDEISATKIRASLIQSLEKWEPRVRIDYANTAVIPDQARVGYIVRVSFFYLLNNLKYTTNFFAPIR